MRLAREAERISSDIAATYADDVDEHARFPTESIEALRISGLLAAAVPEARGGAGLSLEQVASVVTSLARGCASTALVYAMHQLQLLCLCRHGHTPEIEAFLREAAVRGLLVASSTTESGTPGGNTRRSVCALEGDHERYRLVKDSPVISYGQEADAILATARASDQVPANEQVMVLCVPGSFELSRTSTWSSLGMRGTCSHGFVLESEGTREFVLTDSFDVISKCTMVPVSHILWSAVWLGLIQRARWVTRSYLQRAARQTGSGQDLGALRYVELDLLARQSDDALRGAVNIFQAESDKGGIPSLDAMMRMNALKVTVSSKAVEVATLALGVVGLAGYRLDSEYSLGRVLRDAHGGVLMINNDRLVANNAQLMLLDRGTL